ncbi:hypothetical protein JOQ06_018719, partial [Pogonophryne albipinna]
MLSFQLPGMHAAWLLPLALTPSAILQDNLAQADKQTPPSVQRGALMKPIPTIINSKCDTESDQDDKEEKEREHVHVTSATICTCQASGTHTFTATVVICILWATRSTLQKDGGEKSRFNG